MRRAWLRLLSLLVSLTLIADPSGVRGAVLCRDSIFPVSRGPACYSYEALVPMRLGFEHVQHFRMRPFNSLSHVIHVNNPTTWEEITHTQPAREERIFRLYPAMVTGLLNSILPVLMLLRHAHSLPVLPGSLGNAVILSTLMVVLNIVVTALVFSVAHIWILVDLKENIPVYRAPNNRDVLDLWHAGMVYAVPYSYVLLASGVLGGVFAYANYPRLLGGSLVLTLVGLFGAYRISRRWHQENNIRVARNRALGVRKNGLFHVGHVTWGTHVNQVQKAANALRQHYERLARMKSLRFQGRLEAQLEPLRRYLQMARYEPYLLSHNEPAWPSTILEGDLSSSPTEQRRFVPSLNHLLQTSANEKIRLESLSILLRMLKESDSPSLRSSINTSITAFILEPDPRSLTRRLMRALPTKWYQNAQAEIGEDMPTLAYILERPESLRRLVYVLSLVRKFHSEHGDVSPCVLQIRELRMVTDTGSFRRHVLRAKKPNGDWRAIELKIPGELPDRDSIPSTHFDLAAELWDAYPEDPGVVKPLFYAQLKGTTYLYHFQKRVYRDYPLGVMAFEYPGAGMRAIHVTARDLDALKIASGLSEEDYKRLRSVKALTTALRITLFLKWMLHRGEATDAHPENWRLQYNDGEIVLVGDFGAVKKLKKARLLSAVGEAMRLAGFDVARNLWLFDRCMPLFARMDVLVATDVLERILDRIQSVRRRRTLAMSILRGFAQVQPNKEILDVLMELTFLKAGLGEQSRAVLSPPAQTLLRTIDGPFASPKKLRAAA